MCRIYGKDYDSYFFTKQVEKAESLQEVELKNASKKIRAEQERELKSFRESLKTELKLLKQEIDLLPKVSYFPDVEFCC